MTCTFLLKVNLPSSVVPSSLWPCLALNGVCPLSRMIKEQRVSFFLISALVFSANLSPSFSSVSCPDLSLFFYFMPSLLSRSSSCCASISCFLIQEADNRWEINAIDS